MSKAKRPGARQPTSFTAPGYSTSGSPGPRGHLEFGPPRFNLGRRRAVNCLLIEEAAAGGRSSSPGQQLFKGANIWSKISRNNMRTVERHFDVDIDGMEKGVKVDCWV